MPYIILFYIMCYILHMAKPAMKFNLIKTWQIVIYQNLIFNNAGVWNTKINVGKGTDLLCERLYRLLDELFEKDWSIIFAKIHHN